MPFDISVPFPIRSDIYTISSDDFASEQAKKKSVYSLVNRKSPAQAWPDVAEDSRTVLYGVSHFIRSFLTHRTTKKEVYESQRFMNRSCSLGGGLYFPFDKWDFIVNDCKGFLPIEVKALPEASTIFPGIPYLQVTNTIDGFGEFAAHIEAVGTGMISAATGAATLTRHWLNKMKEYVAKDIPAGNDEVLYETAQFMLHCFMMRACSVPEESELLGLAKLLSFHGSDTTNASYLAWKMGCHPKTGTSILASAHRTILGYDYEEDAHRAVVKAGKRCNVPISSNVADCYNFVNAVSKHLLQLAQDNPNDIIVNRSDSGDAVKNILTILRTGLKNTRALEGNSVTPKSSFEILDACLEAGFQPTLQMIFGSGGYVVNNVNRDSLSAKFALTNVSGKPKVKLSEEIGKMTIPGPNCVIKYATGPKVYFENELINNARIAPEKNQLQVVYTGGTDGPSYSKNLYTKFSVLQDRCIKEFDSYADFAKKNPTYGLNGETYSNAIKSFQKEVYDKHRS